MEELSYYEAQILEPEPPEFDLSGLSFSGLIGYSLTYSLIYSFTYLFLRVIVKLCAVPVAYGLQLYDLSTATYRSIQRYIAYRRRKQAEQSDASYGGTCSTIYSLTYSLTHSLTHSLTQVLRKVRRRRDYVIVLRKQLLEQYETCMKSWWFRI